MNLVALYKTFDGGEFVDASLASVYEHVAAIVMVHSDVSWLGSRGNTVREAAFKWCEKFDRDAKVHHLNVELSNQEAQYAAGIDYIEARRLPCDAVMVVDADEVWEDTFIENAKRQMVADPFPAYRSNMQTYLKTPFYRVAPHFGSPTTFLREPKYLTESPRGCRAPARQMSDVWMHHYTYCRATRADVERKLHQSCFADGNETVVPNWMETIYDRLPEGKNLHAFMLHRHVWERIEKVWLDSLPPAMRTARLMPQWFPAGHLLDGELNAIHRLASGRGLAVDLGTYRGLSAVTLSLACRRVHTVDCYADLPPDSFADTLEPERYRTMQDHSLEANRELAARFGNITVEANDSADAGRNWRGGQVDVLFVDADHSEAGTLRNVEAWMPHLIRGSLIICHDDNEIHPGVQSAIRRLRSDSRFRFIEPGDYSGSLAACEVA